MTLEAGTLETRTREAGTHGADPAAGDLDRWLGAISFEQIVRAVERVGANTGSTAVIALYQHWIAGQKPGHPHLFAAWFNLGAEFGRAGKRAEALVAYRTALALRPDFHAAAVNLGLILESLGQTEAALQTWAQALQADGDGTILLLKHRARLLGRLGRLSEAEAALPDHCQGQGSALDPQGASGPLDPAT